MTTTLISVGPQTAPDAGNGNSARPDVSTDGRYVAFASAASNLVAGDTNSRSDVFVRDRLNNTTTRVSVDAGGSQANGHSDSPAISADGRYVAFESEATNLVPGDTNGTRDIFLHDNVAGTTVLVSVGIAGAPANGHSYSPAISADGRFVAFASSADNLLPGETNYIQDIFRWDTVTHTTVRISVSTAGAQGGESSSDPSISADGRYVAFASAAPDLVSNDTNSVSDVFLRDTVARTTTRVSVAANGAQSADGGTYPSLSADGRLVAFLSGSSLVVGDTNDATDVYVRDLAAKTTIRESLATGGIQANGLGRPALSADGRFVAFLSSAANLAPTVTGGWPHVFVRDRQNNVTTWVTQPAAGSEGNGYAWDPAISGDGRIVAFQPDVVNLVTPANGGWSDVFARDIDAGATSRVTVAIQSTPLPANEASEQASINADGRFIAFRSSANNLVPGDNNTVGDIFLRDMASNALTRVNVGTDGTQDDRGSESPSVSANGRFVAFVSYGTRLAPGDSGGWANIYLRDTLAGTTTRITVDPNGGPPDHDSRNPSVSADGRYVAFSTSASNLVAGNAGHRGDILVRDTLTNTTELISAAWDGTHRDGFSASPVISPDGRYVAFNSDFPNLVPGDTNGVTDVFVRDRVSNTTFRASVGPGGVQSDGGSNLPAISPDGRYVAFRSAATNLAPGDVGFGGVFVRDTLTNTTTRVSVATDGTPGYGYDSAVSISADGRYVAFASQSSNLVPGDTNGVSDIFVRDTVAGTTTRVSLTAGGAEADATTTFTLARGNTGPALSADGRFMAFTSDAWNLVPHDTNAWPDVFIRGPFFAAPAPFTASDVRTALRVAGGLTSAAADQAVRLDVENGLSADRLDIRDAVRLSRKVAGQETNP